MADDQPTAPSGAGEFLAWTSGLDHEKTLAQPPAEHDNHAVPIEATIESAPMHAAYLTGFVQTLSALTPDRPRSSSPLQADDAMYQHQAALAGYHIPRRCMAVVTGFSNSEESDGLEDDSTPSTLWAGGSVEQTLRRPTIGDAPVVLVGAVGLSDPVMYDPLSVAGEEDISPQQAQFLLYWCEFQ